jgi:hypothetical protein
LFGAKRPQRRGELKDRGDGKKGVQHQEGRGVMAHGKLQGHADQSHREGLSLRFVCPVLSHMGKALVQAGLKGETKGLCE